MSHIIVYTFTLVSHLARPSFGCLTGSKIHHLNGGLPNGAVGNVEIYPTHNDRQQECDLCVTNHNPSMGIFNTVRPITTPQWESSTLCDQSGGWFQPTGSRHFVLYDAIGIFNTVRPITTPQRESSTPCDQSGGWFQPTGSRHFVLYDAAVQ
jgi:hypothetical protein